MPVARMAVVGWISFALGLPWFLWLLAGHSRQTFGTLESNCRQCIVDGPGVPSDQVPAKTMKTVTRSSGSSAAITGEPGRLAPQLFTASPETKNIRCGCQLMSWSFRYCCLDIM